MKIHLKEYYPCICSWVYTIEENGLFCQINHQGTKEPSYEELMQEFEYFKYNNEQNNVDKFKAFIYKCKPLTNDEVNIITLAIEYAYENNIIPNYDNSKEELYSMLKSMKD